jgi:hypothetical protein
MKLAEALALRTDVTRKVEQLRHLEREGQRRGSIPRLTEQPSTAHK